MPGIEAGSEAVEDAELGDHNEMWQLVTNLVDRDAEISALNREFGALKQRFRQLESIERSAKNEEQGWFERTLRALGLLKEVKNVIGVVAPDETRRIMPLTPFGQERERVIVVTAFGLSGDKLERVLDIVASYCKRKSTVAVMLTDNENFETFRERGMAFEYLPSAQSRDQFAPDLEWPLYFQRRLSLIRRKWRPVGIITFGTRTPVEGFDKFLSAETPEALPQV